MSPRSDPLAAAKAALDQLDAMMQDTIVPKVVGIEKAIINRGGSEEVAINIAVEYGARLFNMFRLGVPPELD